MRIDFHTHIIPDFLPDLSLKYSGEKWPTIKRNCSTTHELTCSCGATIYTGGKHFRNVEKNCWDAQERMKDMDRHNVLMQVLSPIPVMFTYWADAKGALEISQLQNDYIADIVRQYPTRFVGLGNVPMQNVQLAIQEMDRCVHKLRVSGLEIGTNVNGTYYNDEKFNDFFMYAEKWNVPLFIHPWDVLGKEKMSQNGLMYTVGNPNETGVSAASLILSGVLEKFPNLKICLAHGGGTFPFILGRLDRGWEIWPHLRSTEKPPSYFAKKLYYDSLMYDEGNVKFLLDKFGDENIVVGSDYPFLLGEYPPGKVIDGCSSLSEIQMKNIKLNNALTFLNIDRKLVTEIQNNKISHI
ncbi:amidohydrolase family protein [Schinkia sp. CFF1]